MEISIETAIEVMKYLKTQNSQLKSIDIAISIMQKYQKIKQLIADCEEYKWERGVVCKREITVEDIREIIDGNDN